MNSRIALIVAGMLAAAPAFAALKQDAPAPAFTIPAAKGGDAFSFSLTEALKRGPVVLYFYPAAFTSGCTVEAHEFAEATPQFEALGATVIGVSADGIDKLKKFSTQECQSKFPLGADVDKSVMKSYDAKMLKVLPVSNRTSYVISPEGKILYVYSALDPAGHVQNTLAAVKTWHDAAQSQRPAEQ